MDAKRHFKALLLGLKAIGLWPPHKSKWYYKLYRLNTLFTLINIAIFDCHLLISAILNVADFERFLIIVSPFMAGTATLPKSSLVYKNADLLQKLMKELDDEEFKPKNQKQAKLLNDAMGKWRFCFTWTVGSTAGNLIVFAVAPLFDAERRLPFDGFFPFPDILDNPLYLILYLWQTYCLFYICSFYIYSDHIYSGFMAAIAGQCSILADTLENLPEISKRYPGNTFEDRMNYALGVCISHHKKILKFADKARGLINWAAFCQYAGPAAGMTFQLTSMATLESGNDEVYGRLVYLVGLLVSPLIYAWFGQEVIVESLKIPQAAFCSGFEDCSIDFKKNLQFFIFRTQKPIKFFIMGYIELSLETYIRLMRSSYSFYTVLKQTSQ